MPANTGDTSGGGPDGGADGDGGGGGGVDGSAGGGGSGASSAGEGAAGGDAPDSGLGADGYLDRESASDGDAGQGSGPDSDEDPGVKRAQGQESGSDDNEDPDWEPPRRRERPLRPWHTAETAGRIGQVVLLRAQQGYRRPPGETVERMLRGAGEVNWRPGLGEAARPAAVRLRQALLGWTAREPVPASEAFARDGPAWQQRADAGEAPAEEPAPSPLPPDP